MLTGTQAHAPLAAVGERDALTLRYAFWWDEPINSNCSVSILGERGVAARSNQSGITTDEMLLGFHSMRLFERVAQGVMDVMTHTLSHPMRDAHRGKCTLCTKCTLLTKDPSSCRVTSARVRRKLNLSMATKVCHHRLAF